MMTPSTLIVVLVASLFVTDDVHSNPISSSEPYFKVLDCGIEGMSFCFTLFLFHLFFFDTLKGWSVSLTLIVARD